MALAKSAWGKKQYSERDKMILLFLKPISLSSLKKPSKLIKNKIKLRFCTLDEIM